MNPSMTHHSTKILVTPVNPIKKEVISVTPIKKEVIPNIHPLQKKVTLVTPKKMEVSPKLPLQKIVTPVVPLQKKVTEVTSLKNKDFTSVTQKQKQVTQVTSKQKKGSLNDLLSFDIQQMSEVEKISKFEDLLRSTNKKNIKNLMDYLTYMGFFTIPASQKHHQYKGGLLDHSLEVLQESFKLRNETKGWSKDQINYYLPVSSIIVTSLLHDLGKILEMGFDDSGNSKRFFNTGDIHGDVAVKILKGLDINLNEHEEFAIRYHMGISSKNGIRDEKSFGDNHLAYLICRADGKSIYGN